MIEEALRCERKEGMILWLSSETLQSLQAIAWRRAVQASHAIHPVHTLTEVVKDTHLSWASGATLPSEMRRQNTKSRESLM